MTESEIADSRLRAALKAYFRWATEAMSAYPLSPQKVPAGLALARFITVKQTGEAENPKAAIRDVR